MPKITVVKNILDANDRIAEENRKILKAAGLRHINLVNLKGKIYDNKN